MSIEYPLQLSMESMRRLRIIILPSSSLESSKFLEYANIILKFDEIDMTGREAINSKKNY